MPLKYRPPTYNWPSYCPLTQSKTSSRKGNPFLAPVAAALSTDAPEGSVVSMPKRFHRVAWEMNYRHISAGRKTLTTELSGWWEIVKWSKIARNNINSA